MDDIFDEIKYYYNSRNERIQRDIREKLDKEREKKQNIENAKNIALDTISKLPVHVPFTVQAYHPYQTDEEFQPYIYEMVIENLGHWTIRLVPVRSFSVGLFGTRNLTTGGDDRDDYYLAFANSKDKVLKQILEQVKKIDV